MQDETKENQIDLGNLGPGTYILRFTTITHEIYSGKLIKN